MSDNETSQAEPVVEGTDPETSPAKGSHKLDRKTLFVFLGFFVALVVLVVLNMN